MKNIKLNKKLLNVFFSEMDSECFAELEKLEEEHSLELSPITGEVLIRGELGTGIYTSYFNDAFFYAKSAYSEGDQVVFWARQFDKELNDEDWVEVELNPKGSDGWSSACWADPKTDKIYSSDFKIWEFCIQKEDDEFDYYPEIFFEDKQKAIVFNK